MVFVETIVKRCYSLLFGQELIHSAACIPCMSISAGSALSDDVNSRHVRVKVVRGSVDGAVLPDPRILRKLTEWNAACHS